MWEGQWHTQSCFIGKCELWRSLWSPKNVRCSLHNTNNHVTETRPNGISQCVGFWHVILHQQYSSTRSFMHYLYHKYTHICLLGLDMCFPLEFLKSSATYAKPYPARAALPPWPALTQMVRERQGGLLRSHCDWHSHATPIYLERNPYSTYMGSKPYPINTYLEVTPLNLFLSQHA